MSIKIKNPHTEDILAEDSDMRACNAASMPSRLARFSKAHCRALDMADYAYLNGHVKLSNKLQNCASYLLFRNYFTVDQVKLAAATFCHKHLLCPVCAVRRGSKMIQKYMERFSFITQENPNLKPYMVTLTIKDGADLKERYNHLHQSVTKFHKKRHRDKGRDLGEVSKAAGAVWSYEIKRGKNSGEWHPHLHAVWLCEEEPDQKKISEEWKHITGDSHQVDVRPFYGEQAILEGFCEVFKYAVKFGDLPKKDAWEAFKTLSSKRLISSFGLFYGVKIPEHLLDEDLDPELPFIEEFYRYYENAGYNLESVSEQKYDCMPDEDKPTNEELIQKTKSDIRKELKYHFGFSTLSPLADKQSSIQYNKFEPIPEDLKEYARVEFGINPDLPGWGGFIRNLS